MRFVIMLLMFVSAFAVSMPANACVDIVNGCCGGITPHAALFNVSGSNPRTSLPNANTAACFVGGIFGNWENTTLASDGYAAFIYQDSGTGFGAWDLVSGASPLTQMNITCIYF